MLSNLTSAFSRSTANLANTAHAPATSRKFAEPTTFVDNAPATALQPSYTPSEDLIYEPQPSAYWAGRFQSLHDRFHGEMLEEVMQNPETFRRYQDATDYAPPQDANNHTKKPQEQDLNEADTEGMKLIVDDEDKRVLQVFNHLLSLCATDKARHSLFEFQEMYARMQSKAFYLPAGGSMSERPPGWVSRMSNALGRRTDKSGGQIQTSMGRRTGMVASVFGNKRSRGSGTQVGPAKERDPSPRTARGNLF
jgi:hypothetical protein